MKGVTESMCYAGRAAKVQPTVSPVLTSDCRSWVGEQGQGYGAVRVWSHWGDAPSGLGAQREEADEGCAGRNTCECTRTGGVGTDLAMVLALRSAQCAKVIDYALQ